MPAPRNDGRRIQGVLDGAGKLLGIMRVAYRRNFPSPVRCVQFFRYFFLLYYVGHILHWQEHTANCESLHGGRESS